MIRSRWVLTALALVGCAKHANADSDDGNYAPVTPMGSVPKLTSDPTGNLRRLTATYLDANYGRCARCTVSWLRVESHSTETVGGGMFPLCVLCWPELTPERRVAFYRALWESTSFEVAAADPNYAQKHPWHPIEAAVLAER